MSKEDYVSMSKFMFMQICQQAEMSIHLSQYKESARSPLKKSGGRTTMSNRSGLKNSTHDAGNPMYETANRGRNAPVPVTPTRSRNEVLNLDKDINDMQLTFDMFKDCLNQFSCLR